MRVVLGVANLMKRIFLNTFNANSGKSRYARNLFLISCPALETCILQKFTA